MKNTRDQNLEVGTGRGENPGLWQLFWSFFKIGLFTIGGGLAMIPLLERIVVEEKRWLAEAEMVDCLAISQALPGVVAVNLATYVGKRKRGLAGAAMATLGVILPSIIIILAIATVLIQVGDNAYVQGAMVGIKAAVCGLIVATVIRIGRRTLKNGFGWCIALAAFALIAFASVNAVFVVLGAALAGVAYQILWQRRREDEK